VVGGVGEDVAGCGAALGGELVNRLEILGLWSGYLCSRCAEDDDEFLVAFCHVRKVVEYKRDGSARHAVRRLKC
jgi:hypothetical protein